MFVYKLIVIDQLIWKKNQSKMSKLLLKWVHMDRQPVFLKTCKQLVTPAFTNTMEIRDPKIHFSSKARLISLRKNATRTAMFESCHYFKHSLQHLRKIRSASPKLKKMCKILSKVWSPCIRSHTIIVDLMSENIYLLIIDLQDSFSVIST